MSDAEKLALAKELLKEIVASHRDDESSDYNECEKAPCRFCELAKTVLE